MKADYQIPHISSISLYRALLQRFNFPADRPLNQSFSARMNQDFWRYVGADQQMEGQAEASMPMLIEEVRKRAAQGDRNRLEDRRRLLESRFRDRLTRDREQAVSAGCCKYASVYDPSARRRTTEEHARLSGDIAQGTSGE